jgi:hypothetical protein
MIIDFFSIINLKTYPAIKESLPIMDYQIILEKMPVKQSGKWDGEEKVLRKV